VRREPVDGKSSSEANSDGKVPAAMTLLHGTKSLPDIHRPFPDVLASGLLQVIVLIFRQDISVGLPGGLRLFDFDRAFRPTGTHCEDRPCNKRNFVNAFAVDVSTVSAIEIDKPPSAVFVAQLSMAAAHQGVVDTVRAVFVTANPGGLLEDEFAGIALRITNCESQCWQ
jgi:hypothetical protein